MKTKKINIGIGFVTGRKNFKNVVKSYLNDWNEFCLFDKKDYALHLFIAYDLKYTDTNVSDYKIIEEDILDSLDSAHYLGGGFITKEAQDLVVKKVLSAKEAKLIFGEGYAMKRNAVLYFALKNKMDYLVFLDDDEYPIANIKAGNSIAWIGQAVLSTHIENIQHCDMTHGHHCGYISPIPQMDFNSSFTKEDFGTLIKAISNDIITWDSVKEKMTDGGISFANLAIIESDDVQVVKEVGGMKFISGANLGFNLKNLDKLFPFYNPPGARGEDTFLSTCLGACTIRKIPSYTFHDGYYTYQRLLSGVLPNHLKIMTTASNTVYKRFLKASIGWIRYKPLLLYITKRDQYEIEISKIRENLNIVIPKICAYFGNEDFQAIIKELDFYDHRVPLHYQDFENTKDAWLKVIGDIKHNNAWMKTAKRSKV